MNSLKPEYNKVIEDRIKPAYNWDTFWNGPGGVNKDRHPFGFDRELQPIEDDDEKRTIRRAHLNNGN